jgi:hypothetical protein
MKRTVTGDRGYVPDFEFSVRDFKKRLGIAERGNVHDVDINGDRITVRMPRHRDERVEYELDQAEFKARLDIADPRPVLIVFASVWDSKVKLSLADNEEETK